VVGLGLGSVGQLGLGLGVSVWILRVWRPLLRLWISLLRLRRWIWRGVPIRTVREQQPVQSGRTAASTTTRRLLSWIDRRRVRGANATCNTGVRAGSRVRRLTGVVSDPRTLVKQAAIVFRLIGRRFRRVPRGANRRSSFLQRAQE
jgi:hypothetical protein